MSKLKAVRGGSMEGAIARWYARNMEHNELAHYQLAAQEVIDQVPDGAAILEVAPGPGFLSMELAKRNKYRVVGLDISHTFVDIALQKARLAGVSVDFQHGNASDMPFENDTFDFVTCWSAFKNFGDPTGALNETYRVLKPGGRALIDDLRRDAPDSAVRKRVASMGLGTINAMLTRWIFRHQLLKRAYTVSEMEALLVGSRFEHYDVKEKPIEFAAWLRK